MRVDANDLELVGSIKMPYIPAIGSTLIMRDVAKPEEVIAGNTPGRAFQVVSHITDILMKSGTSATAVVVVG